MLSFFQGKTLIALYKNLKTNLIIGLTIQRKRISQIFYQELKLYLGSQHLMEKKSLQLNRQFEVFGFQVYIICCFLVYIAYSLSFIQLCVWSEVYQSTFGYNKYYVKLRTKQNMHCHKFWSSKPKSILNSFKLYNS
ncbi:transmembrane protein, putative (macronuclear) [Tetrahymena thermophila SB210]|uniref:Transmembrane protein, putative n=1 Tax=Tetrahymena thermophila (strain SB210) TaxID=312017 RepID=W7XDU1_TETTS|nr:transmembrane protein, putative [Tetrahymena thermophila SB210]EWS72031.1 transmembrane protein, putative [Tetrahymena thermophila SB210]|eukprot:XP_012655438.1 transmembrane protein, putative [Tetrahymena thermophila SB210]